VLEIQKNKLIYLNDDLIFINVCQHVMFDVRTILHKEGNLRNQVS
jgi:hypothetical protein